MKKTFLFALILCFGTMLAQKRSVDLNGEQWEFKNTKETQWLPAVVPGTVHTDLMSNGKIPDPYLDENEKKVQWIENEDWDYRRNFTITKNDLKNDHVELVFDGLDTFAEVFLNGKSILKADNMFRKWTIPVRDLLKLGDNEVKISFQSAVNVGNDLAKKIPFQLPESPRSTVRKAQYQFGWDWGPRLVTAGIWQDVHLDFWNDAKIDFVQIEQKTLNEKVGDLSFNMEVASDNSAEYLVKINGEIQKEIRLKKGINKITIPYSVAQPKLWQPNGWGNPTLYDFEISLVKNDKVCDQRKIRHGFRTIELIQDKDKIGKSFYFKVNGKPLYIKGTNWIPGDSFLPRITAEKYRQLMNDAADAHMNMVRVWGGGIYEDEAFFDAADELGILIWQDFAFAGSFYPADQKFANNVKQEVIEQARRLQNHPSLALWCGNNEVDEAIVNWGYQKQFKYTKQDSIQVWNDYRKIFHDVIPNALNEVLVKDHIYWPSSPSIGWGHKESLEQGDSHYWGVWWGEQPFEIYNEKVGRFMSEYGFQGMPSMKAYRSMFSGQPDLSLKNPVVKAHQKHGRGWEIIDNYMKRDYVVPKDFEKYDYVSQLLQARGMAIAMEAHRRNQPYNMGTLIWQLNDCWPVASWSAVDYTGTWKALQYQTVRSFTPQAIFGYEKNDKIEFFAVNDGVDSYQNVRVSAEVTDFNGKVEKEISTAVDSNELKNILELPPVPISELIEDERRNKVFLHLVLKDGSGKTIAKSRFFFAPPKDLLLTRPHLKIKKISSTKIEISTDVFAKDVYLKGDTHYSDNYFDLAPGETKIITSSSPVPDDIAYFTLYDTMN